MLVQFPIGPAGLDGLPDLDSVVGDEPFGPRQPSGFSDQLRLTFGASGAQLVAPFDGFMRRIVPDPAPLPGGPLDVEFLPRVRDETLRLRAALGGQIPRVRLLGVDAVAIGPAVTQRLADQVTAVDPSAQALGALEDGFAQGAISVFVERGAVVATGATQVGIQVLTRDGVAADPVAVFSDYLADNDDLVAERAWLQQLLATLTRRVLIQVVNEFGEPYPVPIVVRRTGAPGTEFVDLRQTGGTIVAAELPAPPLVESITITEPVIPPEDQGATTTALLSEWPFGGPRQSLQILVEPATAARTRRFVVATLPAWFVSQGVEDPSLRLPRYTVGNDVEPLIDGIDYYQRLYDDIKALPSAGPGRFFYLSSWRLAQRLQLVRTEDDSVFEDLVQSMTSSGVVARFLHWDQFQLDDTEFHTTLAEALAIVIVVGGVASLWMAPPGSLVLWATVTLASPLVVGVANSQRLVRFLSTQFETNERSVVRLREVGAEAILDGKVRMTREPAHFPLLYDFIGSHHQKIGVVASETGAVGYCGGMDIWPDRLDDQQHLNPSPYHDLHTRVTGPAVADIITTFRQRWNDHGIGTSADDDGSPPLPETGSHVVQVARTFPRELSPSGDRYPFAPDGDFTIRDGLRRAIQRARRYIYVEDQYMTFAENSNPVNDLRGLLVQRLQAVPGLKLVMVLPRASDQPENSLRRAQFLNRLLEEFPDPSRIMVFFRTRVRPVPHPSRPGTVVSRLAADIDGTAQVLPLDDGLAFADRGFVRIGTEEIKYGERDESANTLTIGVEGRRGFNNSGVGPHAKGTRVHQIAYNDVFVHTKMWLIDDLFGTLGSANTNMRGMTHDSECNLFVLDGELDREARRFVKTLRVDLWADHLGLPHSGAIRLLLDDVDAALKLLARHPSPAAGQLRRFWREFSSDLLPESAAGFAGTAVGIAPYWDATTPIGILDPDEFWDTYVDPDGSIPFT